MCSLNLTENPSDKLIGKFLFKVINESTGLLLTLIKVHNKDLTHFFPMFLSILQEVYRCDIGKEWLKKKDPHFNPSRPNPRAKRRN